MGTCQTLFDRPPLQIAGKNAWKTRVFAAPHFGPPADLIREISLALEVARKCRQYTYSVSWSLWIIVDTQCVALSPKGCLDNLRFRLKRNLQVLIRKSDFILFLSNPGIPGPIYGSRCLMKTTTQYQLMVSI